ncbi:MAG: target of Sbf [Sclerophora amabilis]|nr:MAG: target of Sbf [Sclerophora amabilis]
MRSVLAAAGAALATVVPLALADQCHKGSNTYTNNAYCQAVNAITYSNFGGSGSYDKITSYNEATGECTTEKQSYNGPFAPLDGQVSIHLRGPLKLKQLAVYLPKSESPKAKRRVHGHHRRHGHQHFHQHNKDVRDIQDRAVGDTVTAVIDGKTVTWANDYAGPGAAGAAAESTPPPQNHEPVKFQNKGAKSPPSSGQDAADPSDSQSSVTDSADDDNQKDSAPTTGDWNRVAYYSSDSGEQTGLTLMGNQGAEGCSGTWGFQTGSSLSYVSSDGTSCASEGQKLAQDNYLPTDTEIAFFSDTECRDGDCGFVRDTVPNYHGWAGDEKAFMFEFQMPDDGKSDMGANIAPNMPSIWLLNADIPRIEQYGDCSCWKSGCGEFDLFEVLRPEPEQKNKAKSTIHRSAGANSAGNSDYFERPCDKTIKVAAVMRGSNKNAHIVILDDEAEFGETKTNDDIDGVCTAYKDTPEKLSEFKMPS